MYLCFRNAVIRSEANVHAVMDKQLERVSKNSSQNVPFCCSLWLRGYFNVNQRYKLDLVNAASFRLWTCSYFRTFVCNNCNFVTCSWLRNVCALDVPVCGSYTLTCLREVAIPGSYSPARRSCFGHCNKQNPLNTWRW